MPTSAELVDQAIKQHQSGRLSEADSSYAQALTQDPHNADALYLRGVLLGQLHNLDAAIDHLNRALELTPDSADVRNAIGNIYLQTDRLDEAAAAFEAALQINPKYVEVRYNLGNVRYRQGNLDEAVRCFKRTLARKPKFVDAHINLGNVYLDMGKPDDARKSLERAIKYEPNSAKAHHNLGNLCRDQNDQDAALQHYQAAINANPAFVEAIVAKAISEQLMGRYEDAVQTYEDAYSVTQDPYHKLSRGLALPVIPDSTDQINQARSRLRHELDQCVLRPYSLEELADRCRCPSFYLAYHGLNERDTLSTIAKKFVHACPDLAWTAPHVSEDADGPDERIRIGFISTFLGRHTIGRFTGGIIRNLDRSKFHVTVIVPPDRVSQVSDWVTPADDVVTLSMNLRNDRRRIADQRLDVLYYPDIGMNAHTYLLAFSRLARVQSVTWGHPITTGIPNMDYFLIGNIMEVDDARDHYSEQLLRFPSLTTYYPRPMLPPSSINRSTFGFSDDQHLYFCPQTSFKFHPNYDAMLMSVLEHDPKGVLVVPTGSYRGWDDRLRARWNRVSPRVNDRIAFLPKMPNAQFMSFMAGADVLLDTPVFGGGSTAFEAINAGAAIVTLPPRYMRGRVTQGLFRTIGVTDCIAESPNDYVNIAFRLANDRDWRHHVACSIQQSGHQVFEQQAALRDMERFFITVSSQQPTESAFMD